MTIKIYNSLTKQKEDFKPLDPSGKEVKMYVCGPTVYDEPHIGHLRSAYVFDVIRRYLQYSGYKVKFVRNVTDVDDKIIDKARESGPADLLAEVQRVSDKYLKLYKDDLAKLGILEPTVEPKATEHIQDMHWLIQKLVESGKAYASGGDVYFDVNGFKDYGKLSHQNKESILQNVRIEKNEKKRDVLDFALWKKVKEGEPFWPSPWGNGRPGWHIECSAMSMKYLGETFDIHGGGRDLIFPHHENEVAQSESVTGSQFARYWIHHGLITVNEQKMSKSLKNYVTLKEIAAGGPARIEELKFLFLGTHYNAPLDFSEEKMGMQKSIRNHFMHFIMEAEKLRAGADMNDKCVSRFEPLRLKFHQAMSDDFNTALAITVMHEIVALARSEKNNDSMAVTGANLLMGALGLLGLSCEDVRVNPEAIKTAGRLLTERAAAKAKKDYALADRLRAEILETLKDYNIEIVDNANGESELRAKLK